MARKIPQLFLTNGKKHICSKCRQDLIPCEAEIEMKPVHGVATRNVIEKVLLCPDCNHLYVTQEMSAMLVKKYPGYYLDVALYQLRPAKSKKHPETRKKDSVAEEYNTDSEEVTQGVNIDSSSSASTSNKSTAYLSNSMSTRNGYCPICNRPLAFQLVNIPVMFSDDNFYRYYSHQAGYCTTCEKAYISEDTIETILSKASSPTKPVVVKLENGTVQPNASSREYLFLPTLKNQSAIFMAKKPVSEGKTNTSNMQLNSQSFLGEMGYSVSKSRVVRQEILDKAMQEYGKRKVSDLIAFFIATREAQENGKQKYSNAIHIWQEDLNYISKA